MIIGSPHLRAVSNSGEYNFIEYKKEICYTFIVFDNLPILRIFHILSSVLRAISSLVLKKEKRVRSVSGSVSGKGAS